MTLPTLPTDNLYKFTYLGGLTLIFFSCILFVTQYNTINEKIESENITITEIKTTSEFISEDIKFIEKELEKIEKETKDDDSLNHSIYLKKLRNVFLKDKNFREYYGFLLEHKEDLMPNYKKRNRLFALIEKNDSLYKKNTLNQNILDMKTKFLVRDYRNLKVLSIISFLLMILAVNMANSGYKKWLSLVQIPSDEKLKLELQQLKSNLESKSQ